MIKGIIFDADGTLLDSMHIWEELGERYLAKKGVRAKKGLGRILYPMTLEESSRYLKEQYSIKDSPDEITKGILELLENFYRDEVMLKKGVRTYLERMKSKGVVMGIATSGDRQLLTLALERLKVDWYFSVITTCSEYNTCKKESFIYLKTAEMLGQTPEETVVFEDMLQGIEAAGAAGFITVAVEDLSNASSRQKLVDAADYYIKDFCRGMPGDLEWDIDR